MRSIRYEQLDRPFSRLYEQLRASADLPEETEGEALVAAEAVDDEGASDAASGASTADPSE